ncbi:uncharacterized protein LOC110933258 [Helianthus annuus]|uniref:uncharacterized protein LOC110933258 n=1 Tax=Helianthus annuus TaxID=4232 RepID=UPI000B8FDF8B|nr:uncharacterized protein LOC110933258 [Helianthus annuus]
MDGIESFIKVAEANRLNVGSQKIWCPCMICKNFQQYDDVKDIEVHLMKDGFMPKYTCWSMHGESRVEHGTSSISLDNHDNDNLNVPNDNLSEMLNDLETNVDDIDQEKLKQLIDDSEKPLYTGSEISKVDVVLKLFNLKSKHGWSDKSFTDLLVLLHDILPKDEVNDDVTKNGPPAKLLWYLPIIPRLKRLFSDEKEAKLLRWHSDSRVKDGKLRHVADSPQWRNIDNMFSEFGNEIRNIRFGHSSDGFNPFGNMSSRHSPKQPGNNIDVYLSPLIDDLKTLWNTDVEVYDAYKKEYFKLRAMIFCTISDFPAYGNLSGYKTKGKSACPVCEDDTSSMWLNNCKKTVYMGHRRFLPQGHNYRNKKEEFDGTVEDCSVRKRFNAFSRVEKLNVVLGKRNRVEKEAIWKKKSIFWDLPYWKNLQVRHCLDVMYVRA